MALNLTPNQLRSLKRVLRAIREMRQHGLNVTAELLLECLMRAFPGTTLETNPLNSHVMLWGSGGPIADSESDLETNT